MYLEISRIYIGGCILIVYARQAHVENFGKNGSILLTREPVWPSIGKGREAIWKPPAYVPAFVHFFKAATSLIYSY